MSCKIEEIKLNPIKGYGLQKQSVKGGFVFNLNMSEVIEVIVGEDHSVIQDYYEEFYDPKVNTLLLSECFSGISGVEFGDAKYVFIRKKI